MRWSLRHAVLAAVAYADVFDSPLTVEELQLWLVTPPMVYTQPRRRVSVTFLKRLHQYLTIHASYVVLHKRTSLVRLRQQRMIHSEKKWRKIRRAALMFRIIPTIQMIGVTGGLAMNNVNDNDDIDLYFVVSDGWIWVTRLLVICIADMMGMRRTVHSHDYTDKLCLNMFVTIKGMGIVPKDQNLYTAHEVLQMKPIFIRNSTYELFLQDNKWARAYLPNAWDAIVRKRGHVQTPQHGGIFRVSRMLGVFKVVENIAAWVQQKYMNRRRTTEVITADVLQFHPNDAKHWVKRALQKRYSALGLPLDKVFFDR